MEKVFVNLYKYGNIFAVLILIVFDEVIEEGRIKKGDRIVFVGFGGGFIWVFCVVKWI